MELQHRGVEGVSDLVRETERERTHGGERFGVGGAALEGSPLGDIEADAVDEIDLAARVAHARQVPANRSRSARRVDQACLYFGPLPAHQARALVHARLRYRLHETFAVGGGDEARSKGLADDHV